MLLWRNLLHNRFVCFTAYDAFIAFSGGDRIESINLFDVNDKNSPWATIRNETYMKNVIAIAFDWTNKQLFYSDITLGNIQIVGFDGSDRRVIAPGELYHSS